MNQLIIPIVLVAVVGLVASLILAYTSQVFAVKEDEKFIALRAELPGANCGGCGFAGCDDYAHAMCDNDEIACTKCSVGGPAVAEKLADILGKNAAGMEREIAFVRCNGNIANAKKLYEYEDIDSCSAAKQLYGGSKECPYGCIGLGDCVAACEFDAIQIIDGVAVVGRDFCKACGACVKACPQKLIKLIPESAKVQVRCSNQQKGADARKGCNVACIGCMQCVRVCPKGAITVSDNLSRIDSEKCIKCGLCAAKCPTGAIQDVLHDAAMKEKIKKGLQAKEAKELQKKKEAALKAKAEKEAAAKAAAEAKAAEPKAVEEAKDAKEAAEAVIAAEAKAAAEDKPADKA